MVPAISLLVELPRNATAVPWDAVPETEPVLQRDLWRYYHPWVKTAVGAPVFDDDLLIENTTQHAWDIWHAYHSLGTIFSQGDRRVRVVKSGLLSARLFPPPPGVEYIMLTLTPSASVVQIVDLSAGEGLYALRLIDSVWDLPLDLPESALLEELHLSPETEQGLKQAGILTFGQLKKMPIKGFLALRELGLEAFRELMKRLRGK